MKKRGEGGKKRQSMEIGRYDRRDIKLEIQRMKI
jgi:hypothetical protein